MIYRNIHHIGYYLIAVSTGVFCCSCVSKPPIDKNTGREETLQGTMRRAETLARSMGLPKEVEAKLDEAAAKMCKSPSTLWIFYKRCCGDIISNLHSFFGLTFFI
jgi:hypothetical protein